MSISAVQETIQYLESNRTNLKCTDLRKVLEGLGFKIKDGRSGHRSFKHPQIREFHGSNYDCGHGRNPTVKRSYIRKIVNVLKLWEQDILEVQK